MGDGIAPSGLIDCAHRCGRKVSVLSCDDHRHCRHGTVCLPCWREIEWASGQDQEGSVSGD